MIEKKYKMNAVKGFFSLCVGLGLWGQSVFGQSHGQVYDCAPSGYQNMPYTNEYTWAETVANEIGRNVYCDMMDVEGADDLRVRVQGPNIIKAMGSLQARYGASTNAHPNNVNSSLTEDLASTDSTTRLRAEKRLMDLRDAYHKAMEYNAALPENFRVNPAKFVVNIASWLSGVSDGAMVVPSSVEIGKVQQLIAKVKGIYEMHYSTSEGNTLAQSDFDALKQKIEDSALKHLEEAIRTHDMGIEWVGKVWNALTNSVVGDHGKFSFILRAKFDVDVSVIPRGNVNMGRNVTIGANANVTVQNQPVVKHHLLTALRGLMGPGGKLGHLMSTAIEAKKFALEPRGGASTGRARVAREKATADAPEAERVKTAEELAEAAREAKVARVLKEVKKLR